MTSAMVLVAALAASPAVWKDDFAGRSLGGRWQWRCPVPGPRISLTGHRGWLRITVPQRKGGYDHWIERPRPLAAPMLTTAAPGGDFSFETHLRLVRWGARSNFHAAAVVGFSPGYVLAWGPFRAPVLGAASPEPQLWCEPTGLARFIVIRGAARDLYLRIVRRGNTYELWFRRAAGGRWTKAGEYHAIAEPSFIGFMGKTFGDGEGMAFEVDYASVRALPTSSRQLRGVLTLQPFARRWPLGDGRFGHFIEHMHRCIYGGLWAEILDNRKFTGPARGGVVAPWRAVGSRAGHFSPDTEHWYAPAQSQRIELRPGAAKGGPVGIAQGPLDLRGDVAHVGHVVAMSKPAGLRLRVRLVAEGGDVLAHATVGPLEREWRRFDFRLPAIGRRQKVDFQILLDRPGVVWLGAVSLMPADNVAGWRRDVIKVLKPVRPPLIRWPGGNFASQYDWRDGIGPRDRRPPRRNRAWGGWEWNDVGTDEFIQLCRLLGAEPYICANAGEGSPREAAEWVEYCNAAADTGLGRLRAAGGHARPYNVRLWGLGNEMYGNWQHGHLDAVSYALKAIEMASLMREVDRPLSFVLDGVEGRSFGDWNEKVVALAGRHSNYLSVHHYTSISLDRDPLAEYVRAVSAPASLERSLQQTWSIARRANGGLALPIALDEWNIWRPERDDQPGARGFYTLREALFAAEIFNALNRLGPKVPIACVTQTVNVLGLIRVHGPDIAPSPSYWVLRLFRAGSGYAGFPVQWRGPQADLPGGRLPLIDASATIARDGTHAWVFLANRHASATVVAHLDLRGTDIAGVFYIKALTADSFLAANDYQHPSAVVARPALELLRAHHGLDVRVPPHSVVAVGIELGR